ncbi:MAG: hypothetical protein IPK82_10080 [Polyangiaceae bacterium]|nr:hypothetical protein [Polyangiaceae bacterium]
MAIVPTAPPARFQAMEVSSQWAEALPSAAVAGPPAGKLVCAAWERFGPAQGKDEYDARWDVQDGELGLHVAIWAHRYGTFHMGTVGKHSKSAAEVEASIHALKTYLDNAPPRNCEVTFAMDAEARTVGVREGTPFSEDASFEKGLVAQLRRVSWAGSVPDKDYGGPVFEADDRALYFWKEADPNNRKAHPEALPALEKALLRWLGRTNTTMNPAWLSPIGKQASCKFIKAIRLLVPITNKEDKAFADKTQLSFCR